MPSSHRLKVLFLCTGNSCRSQMTEGWARRLKGGRIEAYSTGIATQGLDPCAVQVMSDPGVDISARCPESLSQDRHGQVMRPSGMEMPTGSGTGSIDLCIAICPGRPTSDRKARASAGCPRFIGYAGLNKHVDELRGIEFDYVVTVGGHAHEHCPFVPGKIRSVHVGFDDPSKLAAEATTEEGRLASCRRVRDEIREFVMGRSDRLCTAGSTWTHLTADVATKAAEPLNGISTLDTAPDPAHQRRNVTEPPKSSRRCRETPATGQALKYHSHH